MCYSLAVHVYPRGPLARTTATPALPHAVSFALNRFVTSWTHTDEAQLHWDAESTTVEYVYRYSSDSCDTRPVLHEAIPSCYEYSRSEATVTVPGTPVAYEFNLRQRQRLNALFASVLVGLRAVTPHTPSLLASTLESPIQKHLRRFGQKLASAHGPSTARQCTSFDLGPMNAIFWTKSTHLLRGVTSPDSTAFSEGSSIQKSPAYESSPPLGPNLRCMRSRNHIICHQIGIISARSDDCSVESCRVLF